MSVGRVRGPGCLGPAGLRPVCVGYGIVGELGLEFLDRVREPGHPVCRLRMAGDLLLPAVVFAWVQLSLSERKYLNRSAKRVTAAPAWQTLNECLPRPTSSCLLRG